MKNDPRTRYTKMIIKKSFLELIRCKPVSKITVREICDRAEINRSTFYKHYLDCYDLLDKVQEDALAQFDAMMAGIEEKGPRPALLAMLEGLKRNAAAFQLDVPNSGVGDFTRQLVQHCYRYLDLRFGDSAEQKWNEDRKEISYTFLIGGVSSIIERWMQRGYQEPPEQVVDAILEMSDIVTTGLTKK